ncbi:MAG: pyridoxal 5'-phosphate synthase glutaminase subunit PdxT [Armatimonadetes bacterium]|nr:pyridoxal 5'-phosphate synthase glutaminase subunit PdxT [Armatimonadota bacterium]
MPVRIGVLSLQGDYLAHAAMLRQLPGIDACLVRDAGELGRAQGLIIPGGESTTIGKLLDRAGLMEPIQQRARGGMPVYGTCAGLILMAQRIEGTEQHRLGLMDMLVARNAFGRQIDSFEAAITVPLLGGEPVRGVFIRAPYVVEAGLGVEVLARYDDRIVAVRQGVFMASAFHPELTNDVRMHRLFADTVRSAPSDGR